MRGRFRIYFKLHGSAILFLSMLYVGWHLKTYFFRVKLPSCARTANLSKPVKRWTTCSRTAAKSWSAAGQPARSAAVAASRRCALLCRQLPPRAAVAAAAAVWVAVLPLRRPIRRRSGRKVLRPRQQPRRKQRLRRGHPFLPSTVLSSRRMKRRWKSAALPSSPRTNQPQYATVRPTPRQMWMKNSRQAATMARILVVPVLIVRRHQLCQLRTVRGRRREARPEVARHPRRDPAQLAHKRTLYKGWQVGAGAKMPKRGSQH